MRNKPKKSITDLLVELALNNVHQFFRDANNQSIIYASIIDDGNMINIELTSKTFELWLVDLFAKTYNKTPSVHAIKSAVNGIMAKSRHSVKRFVFNRVGRYKNSIYVDLCNKKHEAIEITSDGWKIVPSTQVRCKFIRNETMLPLPYPQNDNISLEEAISKTLNLYDEKCIRLVIAWLLNLLTIDDQPYPIMLLTGEQGSGKSTFSKLLKSIVDPSTAPIISLPKEERDVFISAKYSFILTYDNISYLTSSISDAFCQLATGCAYRTRQLYQNDREIILNYMRPIILNGIGNYANRNDLISRIILLELPPIKTEDRKPLKEIKSTFKQYHPVILAKLFNLVVNGLRNIDKPLPENIKLPRMADFAEWIVRCYLENDNANKFIENYLENQQTAIENNIENDNLLDIIEQMIQCHTEFTGTTKQILEELNRIADDEIKQQKDWPKNAKSLAYRLTRNAPAYRQVGIYIDKIKKIRKGTIYKIYKQ